MKKLIAITPLFFSFAALSDIAGLTVNQNTISWTESGWMQVQNSSTFESICQGSIQSCDVTNGTFQVINHSTGNKQINIVVSQAEIIQEANSITYVRERCTGLQGELTSCTAFCPDSTQIAGVPTCYAIYNQQTQFITIDGQQFSAPMSPDITFYIPTATSTVQGSEEPRVPLGAACFITEFLPDDSEQRIGINIDIACL